MQLLVNATSFRRQNPPNRLIGNGSGLAVDATPEALKPGIATAVPGLFLIMESDRWAIHVGWDGGLDGFERANLSPG